MNNKLSGGLYETKDQILACLFLSTQGDRPHLPEHKGQTPFFSQFDNF